MKWRFTSLAVVLFYVFVAGFFGIVHDHHHGEEHCAACAWLAKTITDVPAPELRAVPALTCSTLRAAPAVVLVAPVLCNTGSRAPPLASA
jgi:hypothetical protein